MSESTDEELMRAYIAGDRSAFAELFERYAPRLNRLLSRDISRAEDASDLVQQAFLQFHRARGDFREGAAVRPWLYTIALNLKRQYFRRAGRRREVSFDPTGDFEPVASERTAEALLVDRELRRALERLPANQREVIILHWFEGLPFAEVADVVGARTSAVKVRAHRGYTKLRALLADAGVTASASPEYPPQEGRRDP